MITIRIAFTNFWHTIWHTFSKSWHTATFLAHKTLKTTRIYIMTLYDEFEKVKGTFQQKVPTSTLGRVQARANYLLQHAKANPDVWALGDPLHHR